MPISFLFRSIHFFILLSDFVFLSHQRNFTNFICSFYVLLNISKEIFTSKVIQNVYFLGKNFALNTQTRKTVAMIPANVANKAPARVYLLFLTFAAAK